MPKKITTLIYSCKKCPHSSVFPLHWQDDSPCNGLRCALLTRAFIRKYSDTDNIDEWISPVCPLEDSQ